MKHQIDKNELIRLFLELVKINSESGNEAEVRSFIQTQLESNNVKSLVDDYGNLIAYFPGIGEPILLSVHMDTVKPGIGVKPVLTNDLITSSGNTILGADDKAGIAAILTLIIFLKKTGISHRSLEIVFTREEEIGCLGAVNLDYSLIESKEGLVLDHCARPGKIVIGAPFLTGINIKITGKASHASKPENGINAIVVAVKALSKLKIGRIDKETTTNVGVINGGLISNGVPESVNIRAEIRGHDKQKHDKLLKAFEDRFKEVASQFGAVLDFNATAYVLGYSVDTKSVLYKSIRKTWQGLNVDTWGEKIGGASDANIFNANGIKAIPLGSGGQYAHTTRESICVGELEDLVKFLIVFTTTLAKK